VARVVVALEDPDPLVAGAGIARLRGEGVAVDVGVGARDAARDLAPYLLHRREGRSFTVAKTAASLDGRTAARDGSSRWITGPAARADVQELRADSQAVVVGSGTALADQPRLTVRDVEPPVDRQPLRVVLDGRGRVPATGPLFETDVAPTLVVTTAAASDDVQQRWLATGAKVAVVAAGPGGRGVDLHATFELLAGMGVLQALVEPGGELAGSLLDADLADRVVAYMGPIVLGREGRPAFDLLGPADLAEAARFTLLGVTRFGDDVRLDYEPLRDHRPQPNGAT
jgi:diaminohydroxyphosphoribosylaminopyrimidine deaminase/5-amino-6-(5-phosphoribosylamino)uracil reductase